MVDGTRQLEAELARVSGAARLAFFTPIHHYPPLADRKATFLMGATGLISSVLLMFSPSLANLIQSDHVAVMVLVLALLVPVIGLLAFGGWIAWRCYVLPMPKMPQSLANYADIARHDLGGYIAAVAALGYDDAIRAMLHYNYSLAQQTAGKFRLVNRSFACFQWALVLWMLLLVTISVAG